MRPPRRSRHRWSGKAQSVAIDMAVDLSTPMANVMAAAAQWERRIIGARTKAALAEKKASEALLGRERVASPETVARLVAMHRTGKAGLQSPVN